MMRFSERYGAKLDKQQYHLRYLPVFADDLSEAVSYISKVLHNPQAAERLVDDTEQAILERLNAPCAFQPYPSAKQRSHPYYRINIRNYSVFYVVIDDVMEVRRFLYNRRDLDAVL